LKDLTILLGGEFFGKVVTFAAFAYLARTLSPMDFGAVEFAVSLSLFFAIVIDCGLGPIGVRELARDRKDAGKLASGIPGVRLLIAIVTVPIMGLTTMITGYTGDAAWLIWLFAFALLAAPWNQQWLLQGLEMMGGAAAGQFLRALAFAVGVLLFVRGPRDLWAVGAVEVLAAVAAAIFYLVVQHLKVTPVNLRFTRTETFGLLREGVSVGLINLVWAFRESAPIFLLTLLAFRDETAWYGAAHRIVFSILGFSALYFFNLYPAIARRVNDSDYELERLLRSSFCVVAWTTICCALVLTLLSRPIMTTLFGPPFAAAAAPFAVLIWTLPATMAAGHARWSLIAAGHQNCVLAAQSSGAVVMLIAGWFLIARYEALGAAWAAVLGCFVVWGVAHAFAVRRLGRFPLVEAARPAMLACVCWLLSYCLRGDGPMAPIVAAAVFVVFAPVAETGLITAFRQVALAKKDVQSFPSSQTSSTV
jgi:O-antigen/teichoic acid export membrane protein